MFIRSIVVAGLLAFVSACATINAAPGVPIISDARANEVRARHVDLVNAMRAERGLRPVQLSARLTAAARTHARDMSNQKRAWHFGSDGTSPKDRAQRAGYAGLVLAENISESTDDELEVFQSWVSQPVTRKGMLHSRATDIGLGWFQDPSGKLWWVQVLGGPATSGPATTGS